MSVKYMDQCIHAALGSLSMLSLLIISEALPFIRRINGNSLVEVAIDVMKFLATRHNARNETTRNEKTPAIQEELIYASDPGMYV